MTSFNFDLNAYTNKCKSSFIDNTSDKTKELWTPLPDNINCICGKYISKHNIAGHLKDNCHKLDTLAEQPTLNSITPNTLNVTSNFDAFKSITCICGKDVLNCTLNDHLQ